MSIKFPNIKHFLSLFLAAVMMVSLLAVNAHAASSNKITDYGDAYGHWAYYLAENTVEEDRFVRGMERRAAEIVKVARAVAEADVGD